MPTYRINTPGPSFVMEFDNPEVALDFIDTQLPSTGSKVRGQRVCDDGELIHFTQVRNAAGKLVSGAVVYEVSRRAHSASRRSHR